MKTNSPLNDAWLFWNAERLEDFPHECDEDFTGGEDDVDDSGEGRRTLRILEDLFLYVAGVSAAMAGVGFALLIGSFISAYATLNLPGGGEEAKAPGPPRSALERSVPGATASLPEVIVMEPAGAAARPARGREAGRKGSAI